MKPTQLKLASMRRSIVRHRLFFAGVLLCLGVGSAVVVTLIPEPKTPSPPLPPVQDLTKQQYEAAKKKYVTMAQQSDPKVALSSIREAIKKDNGLLKVCHAVVHEIGHQAYIKYGDFGQAMKYQDEVCNSGYLHGIIEKHFEKSPDVFSAMQSVCEPYAAKKFMSWECYHGVGHGLMFYTANDLPTSLSYCDKYANEFAASACKNGIFMENFNANEESHPSKYLKKDDPSYPCANQTEVNKSDCYTYAPANYLRLHPNQYKAALDWCNTVETDYRDVCTSGLGSHAMKENNNNPRFTEDLCTTVTDRRRTRCLEGMVTMSIFHYGELSQTETLCTKMKKSNQLLCHQVVEANRYLF